MKKFKKYKTRPIRDLYSIFSMIADEIEKEVFKWHEAGGDFPEILAWGCLPVEYERLESYISMLDDLLFNDYVTLDYEEKKYRYAGLDSFSWSFLKSLRLVKKIVTFPSEVEAFYFHLEQRENPQHSESHICGICGRLEAELKFENLEAHWDCAIKNSWSKCLGCDWLYPNVEICTRASYSDSLCSKNKLVKLDSD